MSTTCPCWGDIDIGCPAPSLDAPRRWREGEQRGGGFWAPPPRKDLPPSSWGLDSQGQGLTVPLRMAERPMDQAQL